MESSIPPDGSLEGVAVARTRIAHVDGRKGLALLRGYLLPELAARLTFEEVAHVVWAGELGTAEQLRVVREAPASLTAEERAAARALARGRTEADALAAAIVLAEDERTAALTDPLAHAAGVQARVPAVVAAVAGRETPAPEGSYARRALWAMGGTREDAAAVRALEVLLNLESEHGFAASTFACRVAASSGASAGVSLCAAVATLSGPRHGGATAEALGVLRAARDSGDVERFVRERHGRKQRLPGFGHRIYKVPDPRVPPLRAAMEAMGSAPLLPVAEALVAASRPLLEPKGIYANIDLYGAVLLDALGIEPSQFVAAFALGLSCGWLAHWREQREYGRLVRPDSDYAGTAQRALPAR